MSQAIAVGIVIVLALAELTWIATDMLLKLTLSDIDTMLRIGSVIAETILFLFSGAAIAFVFPAAGALVLKRFLPNYLRPKFGLDVNMPRVQSASTDITERDAHWTKIGDNLVTAHNAGPRELWPGGVDLAHYPICHDCGVVHWIKVNNGPEERRGWHPTTQCDEKCELSFTELEHLRQRQADLQDALAALLTHFRRHSTHRCEIDSEAEVVLSGKPLPRLSDPDEPLSTTHD